MTSRMKSKLRDEICEQISVKRCKLNHLLGQKVKLEEELKQLKCRYNDFNGINALPFEVLCLILERVPLQDLLQCELVCQKWNEITKQLKIEEAVIVKLGETPRNWYYSDQPVQPGSVIVRTDLNFENFEGTFLSSIKRLKICNSSDDSASNRTLYAPLLKHIEFVIGLIQLEVLEIAKFKFNETVTLILPKLKYLAIRNLASEIKLNCPSLERLKIDESSWYPDYVLKTKITHLYLGGSRGMYRNNEMFSSLQYLCWKADSQVTIRFCNPPDLPTNPTLKVLSIRPKVKKYYYEYCKKHFLRFLEQKQNAGRSDLKLVFFGVLLEDAAQLENLDDAGESFKDLTKLQLRNYDKLYNDELRWIKIMNYSSVMRCISDGTIDSVPDDLHQRFDRVREVQVDAKIEDEQHLLEFLRKFRNFEKLKVSGASLGTAFYERIAAEFPQIRKLSILQARKQIQARRKNKPESSTFEANKHFDDLEFIFKFINLVKLTTYLPIKKEFVAKLFDTFPIFTLSFAKDRRFQDDYQTFKRAHPRMRIECQSHELRDFYDVQELIEYYFRDDINEENQEEPGQSDESDSD